MRLDEFVGPGSPFVQKRDSASSVLDSLANFNENLIMKGADDTREMRCLGKGCPFRLLQISLTRIN